MLKIFHVFGLQQWRYANQHNERTCHLCPKHQQKGYTEPASGWGADYYWLDVSN